MPGSVSERKIARKVHIGQKDHPLLSYNDTVFLNHRFPVLGHMRGTLAVSMPRRHLSDMTKLPPLIREFSFLNIQSRAKGPLPYAQTIRSSSRGRLEELIRSRKPRIRHENEKQIVDHLRKHLSQRRDTARKACLKTRRCANMQNKVKDHINGSPTHLEEIVEGRLSRERERNVNGLPQVKFT